MKKLSSADPIKALSELIWNSVDADATRVDIEIDSDDFAMRSVTVRDNGHGISEDESTVSERFYATKVCSAHYAIDSK
ncbi:ATP-binding protein [uncultured Roseibium sp.]|uniref:ATP-binding protein n=1 Tax=uncultured Roseibium sp. TaxID=1936171 RepID=UPI00374CE350